MKVIILIFAFALLIFTLGTLNKREGFDKRDTLMNACGSKIMVQQVIVLPIVHIKHVACLDLKQELMQIVVEPIGKASERAFKEANNRDPRPDELTPWCTCFGSKVFVLCK